jgi:hypothetical protein
VRGRGIIVAQMALRPVFVDLVDPVTSGVSSSVHCVTCDELLPVCTREGFYCLSEPQTCDYCPRCVCFPLHNSTLLTYAPHSHVLHAPTKCVNFERYNSALDAFVNRKESRSGNLNPSRWTLVLLSKYLTFSLAEVKTLNEKEILENPKKYHSSLSVKGAGLGAHSGYRQRSRGTADLPYLLLKPVDPAASDSGMSEPDIVIPMELNEFIVPMSHAMYIRDTRTADFFLSFFGKLTVSALHSNRPIMLASQRRLNLAPRL